VSFFPFTLALPQPREANAHAFLVEDVIFRIDDKHHTADCIQIYSGIEFHLGFLLSGSGFGLVGCSIVAAKRFFAGAIKQRGVPGQLTLDGYAASRGAVAALREESVLSTLSWYGRTST
jgi:hypothetical protein